MQKIWKRQHAVEATVLGECPTGAAKRRVIGELKCPGEMEERRE